MWPQAEEAGGERGRVPSPKWKTGATKRVEDLLLFDPGKPEDTRCHCRDRGAVQDKGRGGQNCDKIQNHPSTKVEIRIKIPEELKSYIVDDWAQICRRKRLTILPARSLKNII